MFISFEGIEGAGKSTQARLLFEHLAAAGYDVTLTREPGGTALAEELRRTLVSGDPESMDAWTELLVFTAARRDHIKRVIRPALERGGIVLSDRFVGSTRALQGAAGVPRETIDHLHTVFCGVDPDLTLFLDFDAALGLERSMERLGAGGSAETRFESKGSDFHDRVDANLRRLAAEDPDWITISATGSVDEVRERIRSATVAHRSFPHPASQELSPR